ncbi:hypothetical protein [Dyadobacter sp. CY312]|uniref:hypothetical protein n=1 Tax=Dyadobacter sp. CY312 TaxID=2907303 RepID=UPI001F28E7EC|nr:hypothetical protein [Dyadobacter sp. CY312]MCE7044401.1 hypothetical protein [Dyadobacter sp. CY312]
MKKFNVCLSLFFAGAVLLCSKERNVDVVNVDSLSKNKSGESDARVGPGYSWNFSTSSFPGEYFDPPGSNTVFLGISATISWSDWWTCMNYSGSNWLPSLASGPVGPTVTCTFHTFIPSG